MIRRKAVLGPPMRISIVPAVDAAADTIARAAARRLAEHRQHEAFT